MNRAMRAVLTVLTLALLYVAGCGPVFRSYMVLFWRGEEPGVLLTGLCWLYYPLFHLMNVSPTAKTILDLYIDLWMPPMPLG